MMNGYVKNMTHLWAHVMKRSVGPGATIPLQELFEQYGERHNLTEGDEFIHWLQDVKLRDRDRWKIFLQSDKPEEEVSKENESKVNEEKDEGLASNGKSRGDSPAEIVLKEMTVEDVVELSVRKAREVIPAIHDIKLLKYAQQNANQRSGKDSLCRLLMRRISELEVSNRR